MNVEVLWTVYTVPWYILKLNHKWSVHYRYENRVVYQKKYSDILEGHKRVLASLFSYSLYAFY